MFQLMTVTATKATKLGVPSVRDYSLLTTNVKRGYSAQNVSNGCTRSVTREITNHLYTFIGLCFALTAKQCFLKSHNVSFQLLQFYKYCALITLLDCVFLTIYLHSIAVH